MGSIVQIVDGEGPNPGSTQDQSGITTTAQKTMTKGNFFFGIITCADFSGPHTSESISDTDKNVFVVDKILTGLGGAGNLNTAQQTILYHVESLVGDATADQIHQLFVGGDNDYQALLGIERTPSVFVGCSGYIQSGVAPGKSIVNSGAEIPYTGPATGYGFAFNVSELGKAGTITPVPTAPSTLVVDALAFYEPQGNNVAVSQTALTGTGAFRAYFDNDSSAPLEDFQTVALVVTDAAVVTPPVTTPVIPPVTPPVTTPTPTGSTMVITAADLKTLTAGGSIAMTVTVGN